MGESCRHHCRFSALRAEELQAKTWPLPHPGSHTVTGSCISAQVPPFTGLLIGGPWPRPLLMVSSRPSLGGPWKHILTLQFSLSVVSNSLWPHNLQHSRLLCWSPTPGACTNSCPSSQWSHPTISCSIISFFSCLQSFPPSRSFQMSQFFASGGQSIGASASASVLPMNIQDLFPLGLAGLIS